MVDLVITSANVKSYSGATTKLSKAGGTVTAGQPVYKDTTTSKYLAADADAATGRTPEGIALNDAALDQPVVVQTAGDIDLGATLVVGGVYVMSDTPGGIMPVADLETGDYVTVIGVATAANKLRMGIIPSGVAVP